MMRQRRGKVHTTTEDQVCGHCGGQVLLAEETIQGITTGDPQLDYRGEYDEKEVCGAYPSQVECINEEFTCLSKPQPIYRTDPP